MDATVSARIPVELRSQVYAKLEALGSTPSELINAAFRYVLEAGELPAAPARPTRRELTPQMLEELRASLRATTFPVPESYWGGRSYKDIIAEGKAADYEALS